MRERRLQGRIRLGSCRNLTALPIGNGVSEGFGQLQTYVRVEEARLLVVSPCGWVMASRHFEGTYHLHVQVYESVKFNNNNNYNNRVQFLQSVRLLIE